MKDGVLYLTAGASVLAVDGATGETRWRWQAEDAESQMAPSWQGVGLNDDLVFVGLRSVQVAALRQDTGELVWATTVGSTPAMAGETVTTAPIHAAGKVFVGVANGDSGGQGRVVAVDAATGEVAWTFFVIPRQRPTHPTWSGGRARRRPRPMRFRPAPCARTRPGRWAAAGARWTSMRSIRNGSR